MTTRQIVFLGIFLLAAAGFHAAIGRLLPASQPPIVSGFLEHATADTAFLGKFANGDPVIVYDRFVIVEHGNEIAVIPADKINGLVLRRSRAQVQDKPKPVEKQKPGE